MRYEFMQRVIEYTYIEAENEEEAWEIFCSGEASADENEYEDAQIRILPEKEEIKHD